VARADQEEAMTDRLREWCERLCEARSDGTWLVRVPDRGVPRWSFVLPDAAAKRDYVDRVERAAREDVRLQARDELAIVAILALMVCASAPVSGAIASLTAGWVPDWAAPVAVMVLVPLVLLVQVRTARARRRLGDELGRWAARRAGVAGPAPARVRRGGDWIPSAEALSSHRPFRMALPQTIIGMLSLALAFLAGSSGVDGWTFVVVLALCFLLLAFLTASWLAWWRAHHRPLGVHALTG
jgi:hypothetical protein